jgi:hypothetical protein
MMMKTNLSPAAQAVLDAFNAEWPDGLAAALVAVADQVVPENANPVGDEHAIARLFQWMRIRWQLLDIAAELEALND